MLVVTDPYNLCKPFDGIFPSSIFKIESENKVSCCEIKKEFIKRLFKSFFVKKNIYLLYFLNRLTLFNSFWASQFNLCFLFWPVFRLSVKIRAWDFEIYLLGSFLLSWYFEVRLQRFIIFKIKWKNRGQIISRTF